MAQIEDLPDEFKYENVNWPQPFTITTDTTWMDNLPGHVPPNPVTTSGTFIGGPSLKILFDTCYVCGLEEDGVEIICGVCREAVQLMRDYMMARIRQEIDDFAEE